MLILIENMLESIGREENKERSRAASIIVALLLIHIIYILLLFLVVFLCQTAFGGFAIERGEVVASLFHYFNRFVVDDAVSTI